MVLTSFMAGLALGNFLTIRLGYRLQDLRKAYIVLELIIGLTGALIVLVLPHLPTLFANLLGQFIHVPWLLNSLRLMLSFFLLAIPTTAMGATLPVMVKLLSQSNDNFGAVLGKFYGWNTLGAVTGALLGELLLVKALGIQNTGFFAAFLNLSTAVFVLKNFPSRPNQDSVLLPASNTGEQSFSLDEKRILVVSFLTGSIMLALEVVWFRFLLLSMSGTSLIFVIMLAIVLLGISLGG
jgi:predicted membrane-bound spermidine synthase